MVWSENTLSVFHSILVFSHQSVYHVLQRWNVSSSVGRINERPDLTHSLFSRLHLSISAVKTHKHTSPHTYWWHMPTEFWPNEALRRTSFQTQRKEKGGGWEEEVGEGICQQHWCRNAFFSSTIQTSLWTSNISHLVALQNKEDKPPAIPQPPHQVLALSLQQREKYLITKATGNNLWVMAQNEPRC